MNNTNVEVDINPTDTAMDIDGSAVLHVSDTDMSDEQNSLPVSSYGQMIYIRMMYNFVQVHTITN